MHVVRWTLALAACSSEPGGSDQPTHAGPPPRGTLEVITVPAGPGTDPDGYRLELNGVVFGAMTSADTLLVGNLPEAEYAVGLAGVAAHCDNGGANPRSIGVAGGRTTRVIFQVKCGPGDQSGSAARLRS